MPITHGNIYRKAGMSALLAALCLILMVPAVLAWADFAPAQNSAPANNPPALVEVSRSGTEARADGVDFALTGFERFNEGTSRKYQGTSFGYRYPMSSQDAFVVMVIDEHNALVYLPETIASEMVISAAHSDFEAMLKALDAQVFNADTKLADRDISYEYTVERSVVRGAYRYDFVVEVEPGYYYATVTAVTAETGTGGTPANDTAPANGEALASDAAPEKDRAGALFCESGLVVSAENVLIEQAPTGFAALREFFTSLDLRPFWVSLKTSMVAMIFVFVLGLLAAQFSQGISGRFKGVLDSLFTIPLVLPPTVCGFLLLILFGKSTAVGRWLLNHGIELIFSWPAAVLAAIVVSFPLMYRTARGAFESLDPSLGDAARTLGWSEPRIFLKLTMPLAWPSIAAGTVLAFARAMGEFGATLFVAGSYPGVTQTMPIAIYFEWMGGHSNVATFWVFVVILFSFVVILFVNWYAAHTQRYRRASSDVEKGETSPPATRFASLTAGPKEDT